MMSIKGIFHLYIFNNLLIRELLLIIQIIYQIISLSFNTSLIVISLGYYPDYLSLKQLQNIDYKTIILNGEEELDNMHDNKMNVKEEKCCYSDKY